MAYKVLVCLYLVAATSANREQSRWSRQISSYTADITDWVPLGGPVDKDVTLQSKRQTVAEPRILTEPIDEIARSDFNTEQFSSRGFYNSQGNRQNLYLQSMPAVPSASQNFLNDQGFNQGFRFGLSPPNFPLTQGFIAPQYNFDTLQQFRPKPQMPTTPIRFENFPPPIQPLGPPQVKPILNPTPRPKFEAPKYVDGYRVDNNSDTRIPQRKPQPPQKIRFEDYDKPKDVFSPAKSNEREEVQLLYVPVESLNRGQFNFKSPLTSSQLLNTDLYNQNQKHTPLRHNFGSEFQRPITRPFGAESFQSPEYLSNFNSQIHGLNSNKFSTINSPFPTVAPTTPKPKKLKPHQPPLAIFLTQTAKGENDINVGDVLSLLKTAKTVPVLDAVNPVNAPEVFIGPSSLTPPEKYVKFELPYLSNIENKDKKLKQLPFFVAPLSYNTPQGFAKIPFPSPHVGSVVINSQIQEASQAVKSSTVADIIPNAYQDPALYKERQTNTQKPTVTYYSTVAPKDEFLNNYEQNYYSFEPQTVNTMRPVKEYTNPVTQTPTKTPSYFLTNIQNPYNPPQFSNFQQFSNYQNPGSIKTLNSLKADTTSTPRTTTVTSKPTTFSNQLLQTHNPFSINQAFQFNTPNDYQNNFNEYKEATQKQTSPSPTATPISFPSRETTKYDDGFKPYNPQLSTQSYSQKYNPEKQFEPESQGLQYEFYNTNPYSTKTQSQETDYSQTVPSSNSNNKKSTEIKQIQNNAFSEVSSPTYVNRTTTANNVLEDQQDHVEATKSYNEYQYTLTSDSKEEQATTTTTTTTTSTTRRIPTRTRTRPRYPINKSAESTEHTTRTIITRKPARERRPLPSRTRYEPHRHTTERTTTRSSENSAPSETSTRSYKSRTRGKIHFKASDGDDIYENKQTKQTKKENDLAYQRDVLHQNYPVTLMERASTLDIEAMTEATGKIDLSENVETTNIDDTENAYSNDKPSITENLNSQNTDVSQYASAIESDTDIYVRKVPIRGSNEYKYQSRTTLSPQDKKSSYEETKESDYSSLSTPDVTVYERDSLDINAKRNENEANNPDDNEYSTESHEKVTLSQTENIKITSSENEETEPEDNTVETTPSYNRVRVRPGVVRQHYQPSSTESSRFKNDRRNNYPITYRPAFDKTRTTMRIEEIEADLKTKQVHSRPEFKDYKQPIYKHEPVTESTSTTSEATTRRQYKRKRPVYTTSTTEATAKRRPYENKNRFRGRRPTEKPTDKPDTSTETASTSTARNIVYNRYNRPKLSDRFNKKPDVDDSTASEDQDSNYSLHSPNYASPDLDRWSPNISNDSFKPYNPNNIVDDIKTVNVDQKVFNDELDIITAKNGDDNDAVLISVTPASNNYKNSQDIPSSIESFVEQAKWLKNDTNTNETASTFESMLEEVMKSLEEQDEDEYTSTVMKHKGGEIGEIPPEKIISSGVNYSSKSTQPIPEQMATTTLSSDSSPSSNTSEEEQSRKSRRRGYWKKVKVRPAIEGIDVAESQYYSDTVNTLGKTVAKDKYSKPTEKNKFTVTTYKPTYQFLKDFFNNEDESVDVIPHIDVPKLNASLENETENSKVTEQLTTESTILKLTPTDTNPGDMDLGTGSPDPTYDDSSYYSEPTEPSSTSTKVDRSDGYSFMDYLFGITSPDEPELTVSNTKNSLETTEKYQNKDVENQTITTKATTEAAYIPDEIITETNTETLELMTKAIKFTVKEKDQVESSSVSSFMEPKNVVSTSMSTEISHETEICFRGKCIKSNKDLL